MPAHVPDFPPYRPPSEAGSVLVRVTRGCPWNRCTFCDMYKRCAFEVRSLEEIEADLEVLREAFPSAHSIFLADSDGLAHPRILEVVEAVSRTFPEAERMTTASRSAVRNSSALLHRPQHTLSTAEEVRRDPAPQAGQSSA